MKTSPPSFLNQHQYCFFTHAIQKMMLAVFMASGLSLWTLAAIAQTSPTPGTEIKNKAYGSFETVEGSTAVKVESNEVIVTISEVAGITLTHSGTVDDGSINTGETIDFIFTVTNIGNDPTQFFIPGQPSSISGGTAGTLELIEYDADGTGASPVSLSNIQVSNSGQATGGTGGLLTTVSGTNSGSVPPGGTIKIKVPVTVTAASGNPISVTLGNTDGRPETQNQVFQSGSQDLYTIDNIGTAQGDTNGDPVNGDATFHRQEASAIAQVNVITPGPDLVIEKSHTGDFYRGKAGSYSLVVSNIGETASSGTITVTDTVPSGLTPKSASGFGWSCSISGQLLTCTNSASLSPGESLRPITLSVEVDSTAPSSITNEAQVSGGNQTNTTNDTDDDPTTIISPPSLTSCTTTGSFDWAFYDWPANSTGTYTFNNISLDIDAQITVNDPDNILVPINAGGFTTTIDDDTFFEGGNNPVVESLRSQINAGSRAESDLDSDVEAVSVTFQFLENNTARSTSGVQFELIDVDKSGASWQDRVQIKGYLNGVEVAPLLTINPEKHAIFGNIVKGNSITVANNNNVNNSGDGNVGVAFPSEIDSFEIIFTPGPDTQDNPNSQGTALMSGLQFCGSTTVSPRLLLVKRITEINGSPVNPYDATIRLDEYIDDETSAHKDDDNHPYWPDLNNDSEPDLIGAINAGKILPGDEVEYTVYFLNAGNIDLAGVKLCDRLQPGLALQSNAYGSNQDIKLSIGQTISTGLTAINDAADRAQLIQANQFVPQQCNLQNPNDNGVVVLDITGTAGSPNFPSLPVSGTGVSNQSYGKFQFKVLVE